MRARRVLTLAAGLGLAASFAGAAPKKAAPATPPAPDVFLGYSYTEAGDASLNGIGLQGTLPVGDTFRLVLDLSGHDGSFAGADFDQIGLMAGGPLESATRTVAALRRRARGRRPHVAQRRHGRRVRERLRLGLGIRSRRRPRLRAERALVGARPVPPAAPVGARETGTPIPASRSASSTGSAGNSQRRLLR